MPMTWNEVTDARLLVGILTTTNVKLDMHALAKFMGPGCTVSAVQHRIQRLKDKVSTSGTASSPATTTATTMTSPGNETPTTPTPATPEKRKRGRPRKNPVVGGGEASTSPTVVAAGAAKKPKAKRAKKVDGSATATAAVVKNEEVSDDDEEEEVLSELGVAETPGAEEGGVGEEVQESPVVKGEEEDDDA
ncbi:uncharacterized protein AKAW2_20693A [Aspergillus luchuensis]|uniref:AT hook motif protein n=1 Tax=Aspergillus kawachii TaxID=1069201 RepID=A0A146FPR5_ASPKA|nr:uncharacterized protein AKAW2_20693A [Aspergillus luchuensis]BCR95753.1 hypothetical protein AKAW2_20693A [Aspergillus luchuensis]BCS08286.1 hypothetical protein ALUC_20656A [Aspergillus luchuensis]GAA83525.1 hypothetical protein AKAW_01640 [Aspergillus luchuensis IFO 4308]GAT27222.1 hypothetical protein RIB2604_02109100 [Aspergillus luchuensis]